MTSAAGKTGIDADVRQGMRRDAILFSVGANANHGLRRTNADKRRAVETLLRDEEWRVWSDHEISRRAGVSPTFVGKVRAEVAPLSTVDSAPRQAADGRVMNTTNIGRRPAPDFAAIAAEAGPVAPEVQDDAEPVIVNAHRLNRFRHSVCALTTT